MSEEEKHTIWEEGVRAFWNGLDVKECPYAALDGSDKFDVWVEGWADAEYAADLVGVL